MGGASESFVAKLEGGEGVDVFLKAALSDGNGVLKLLLSLSKGGFGEGNFIMGV